MKKIIALVMGIAFAFGTAGFATAQTPAPKAEEKKADDMKKSDKAEKKGEKKAKEGRQERRFDGQEGRGEEVGRFIALKQPGRRSPNGGRRPALSALPWRASGLPLLRARAG